jgi:hypothetical protein
LEQGLPAGEQQAFPYELLLRFANDELDAAARAGVQRQLATDPRWRAHHESVRHLKLERLAARRDARALAGFNEDKATPFCLEVARTGGDALLPLVQRGGEARPDLQQHVEGCVFCGRMSRLAQARVLAEAHRLPPGEKLLRDWLLEPTYGPALEQVLARLRAAAAPAPRRQEEGGDASTVIERQAQGDEETVILPGSPPRKEEG